MQAILPSSRIEKQATLAAISDEAARLVFPADSSSPLLFIFLGNQTVYNNHLLSIPFPVPPEAKAGFDRFIESLFAEMRARGAEALRSISPSIPVYAVSASARPEDIAEGRGQGFTDYLSKPVPLAALCAVLDIATSPNVTSRDDSALDIEPPRFPEVPQKSVETFGKQTSIDQKALTAILERPDLEKLKKWAHGVSRGLSVLGPSILLDLSQELRLQIATCGEWTAEIEQLAVILGEELAAVRDAEQARHRG
ncbi:hypothetical protein LMG28614_03576 [Paraburkholderia ultramafica]|uniref:Response regulatory domain-containing protein n=1 Tax=Paraburkholderia ultramafica TaxID=1544867 RepID=A0A6S7B9W7_9BURK|nr:hypothetical protein [Paraburkholderia ultramafica]CAB3792789.1 hypothetical protein LMG28614_03576 [Paraburkholderia ultramafica]